MWNSEKQEILTKQRPVEAAMEESLWSFGHVQGQF